VRIALFVTCLCDQYLPRSAIAVVKVLEHFGHTVTFPTAQTCCGQPMFNNGFHEDARDLARRMIDVFGDAERVVTPSGSCAAMLKEHYPELFETGSPDRAAAQDLAGRTWEFVQFMTDVLNVDLAKLGARWPGSAATHFSCHLRAIGVTDETAKLAGRIDGLSCRPLDRAEQCCGFGGTFAVSYPGISGAMVRDKVAAIEAAGVSTVISNDPGCTMNMAGACRRAGCDVSFRSMAEVVAEGLGLLPREGTP